MANRAYLYCLDSDDYSNEKNWWYSQPEELEYMDSRHNIPFAWFFLFRTGDVKFVNFSATVHCPEYKEAKLFTSKSQAIETFTARTPLLMAGLASEFDTERLVTAFFDHFCRLPGEYVYMDPSEVLYDSDDGDEISYAHLTRILNVLDNPAATLSELVKELSGYSYIEYDDEWKYTRTAVGVWYFE